MTEHYTAAERYNDGPLPDRRAIEALFSEEERLPMTPELAYRMVRMRGDSFADLPEDFRDMRYIAETAIRWNPEQYQHVGEELREDYDLAEFAVKRDGLTLQYASEAIKDNYDIVMFAVKNNGLALQSASDRLRNDEDIVWEAMEKGDTGIFQYAGDELRKSE